jgi:hypothetical protein
MIEVIFENHRNALRFTELLLTRNMFLANSAIVLGYQY